MTVKLNWRKSETHGLEPDPEPRPIRHTLFSTDDHLVEPPHMFEGRLPAAVSRTRHRRSSRPRKATRSGSSTGKVFFQVGLNAVVGRKREDWKVEPTRFDEMRPGCYEIEARVRDMDINGVWASVNFPSQITGFCGAVFSRCSDPELGLAVTRAWNDWFHDEWYSPHPDRIVPMGITYLADAEQGAEEIRRNAARGFTAVTLPEMPHRIGMEPIFSQWWEPIIAACEETDTVICLHVGSTGVADMPPGAPMVPLGATLFGQLSLSACAEWLWSRPSGAPPRPQDHHERGRDRLGRDAARPAGEHRRPLGLRPLLPAAISGPSEVLRRNFWFATIDDPSTLEHARHDRRREHHVRVRLSRTATARGPTRKQVFADVFGGLPADEIAQISHENAAALFRHPLPPASSPHAIGLAVSDRCQRLRDAAAQRVSRRSAGRCVLRCACRRNSPTPNGARSSRRCRRSRRAP